MLLCLLRTGAGRREESKELRRNEEYGAKRQQQSGIASFPAIPAYVPHPTFVIRKTPLRTI